MAQGSTIEWTEAANAESVVPGRTGSPGEVQVDNRPIVAIAFEVDFGGKREGAVPAGICPGQAD